MASPERRADPGKSKIKPKDRCGPASVRATAEGEGATPEEAVDMAGQAAVRMAGKLCKGQCDGNGVPCEFTPTEAVVARPPTKIPQSNPVRYLAEVTTSGKCECQA